jgi:hypothetical protein
VGGRPSRADIEAKIGLGYGDVRFYKLTGHVLHQAWGHQAGHPGWGEFAAVFGGAGGNIFGITHAGQLIHMQHTFSNTATSAGTSTWTQPRMLNASWSTDHGTDAVAGGWKDTAGQTWMGVMKHDKIFLLSWDGGAAGFGQKYLDTIDGDVTATVGPKFSRMFGGQDHVYYLTTWDGELYCYKPSMYQGKPVEPGSKNVDPGATRRLVKIQDKGAHDGTTRLFGGAGGVIYTVDASGTVSQRRHTGRADCSSTWGGAVTLNIGTFAGFREVISGDEGVIYAVPRQVHPLTHGSVVALYSPSSQRFLRATVPSTGSAKVDASPIVRHGGVLPPKPEWTGTRWKVVVTASGEIGLWNLDHERFLRVHENFSVDLSTKSSDTLPADWSWERFKIYRSTHAIQLFSTKHSRFLTLQNDRNSGQTLQTFSVKAPSPVPNLQVHGRNANDFEIYPVN